MAKLSLTKAKYVLFKEDGVTHEEIYFKALTTGKVEFTFDLDETPGFATAAEAYRFGELAQPALDWWRVGLRA